MIFGHPALRLLARRKLVGIWRRQKRRLKRPSGIAFALLGLLAIGYWIAVAIVLPLVTAQRVPRQPLGVPELCVVGFGLTVFTLIGSLNFRGLYLPKEEIDRLFSSPVSRSDLVRYRLITSLGRSLFGALFFGAVLSMRLPHPMYGFLGAVVSMLTLPLLGQAASLLLGDAENRMAARLAKLPIRWIAGLGVAALMIFLIAPVARRSSVPGAAGLDEWVKDIFDHPLVSAVCAPLIPWARMSAAHNLSEFLPWFAACFAIWFAMFELTARIPIDFRELSLETSADVAKRIHRARRGALGASGTKASSSSAGWRVPWWFGRGPFGAIAWRKSATILRKARGTFITSALIVAVLTAVSTILFTGKGEDAPIFGSLLISLVGTLYLCAGLRFDFREDLDRMDVIKSYPLAPWRVFLATLLPEISLVTVLLCVALVIRVVVTREYHPSIVAMMVSLPGVVLAWVAIDNAVFLFSPVRYVPGQEGLLNHAGRSMVVMLLRMLMLLGVAIGVGLAVGATMLAQSWLEFDNSVAMGIGVMLGVLALIGEDVLLVMLGGKLLARFDVARDRA